jgi:hypothetical protein
MTVSGENGIKVMVNQSKYVNGSQVSRKMVEIETPFT